MSEPNVTTRHPWLVGVAIGLPLALLIVLSILTHHATRDLARTQAAVNAVAEAQALTRSILEQMLDNESGQRGYVLSGNPVFLEPYDLSLRTLPKLRQRLERRLPDDEARTLFGTLSESLDARLAFAAKTVELERSGSHAASVALVATGRGKLLMDQVRKDKAALEHHFAQLAGEQEAEYSSVVRNNERVSWALVAADVLIMAWVISLLVRLRRAEGIVTVCAWSKTVRLNGAWVSYDEYLTRQFGVSITHGISPEEARKMREMIEQHPGSGIRPMKPLA